MPDETTSMISIIDRLPNEIYIFARDPLKLLYANDSAKLNLGYSMKELRKMTPIDIFPLVTTEYLHQLVSTLKMKGSKATTNFETILQRKNKTTYPVEIFLHHTYFNKQPAYVAFVLNITQRKQGIERLELALQCLSLGYWDWDLQTDGHIVNDRWLEMLGLDRSDIKNNADDWLNRIHPDDRHISTNKIEECIRGNQSYITEFRMKHKKGHWIWIQGSGAAVEFDPNTKKTIRLCGTYQDITARKEAEVHTKYIKRVLKTLLEITQSIGDAPTESSVLQQTCRTLIETGGYYLAWIAYAESDTQKTIRPAAQCGLDDGYIQSLDITWADTDRGQGPIGTAIRTKQPVASSDIRTDPAFKSGSDSAINCGLKSCVVLPLIVNEEVLGSLNIYASETYAFNDDALTFLQDLASAVAFGMKNQRLQIEHAAQLSKLESSLIQTINAIALALEKRDPYTAGHMTRVAQLAVAIAKKLKLSDNKIIGIRLSATIHDLGKIYVPAEILNRPGKLTDPEFEIIKSHSQVGHDIIKGIDFPWEIAEMILQHHERLDGSGYPKGLKGEAILFEAQIICVADAVEAISSHRPYRESLGIEFALETIKKGKGHHFIPEIVDACVQLFEEEGFELMSTY